MMLDPNPFPRRAARRLLAALLACGALQACGHDKTQTPSEPALTRPRLESLAVLPAATWAAGPTSGARLAGATNGFPGPYVNRQPVQGFSGVLDNGDGTFLAMPDNGYGSMENSADFNLRVYTVRPEFKAREGGRGSMIVEGWFELSDPDKHVPFAITNHFTTERILTGADFDIESLQRAPDGTFWFGDEFGPFLLHTDATGKLLEAPIPLPDFDNGGETAHATEPLRRGGLRRPGDERDADPRSPSWRLQDARVLPERPDAQRQQPGYWHSQPAEPARGLGAEPVDQ